MIKHAIFYLLIICSSISAMDCNWERTLNNVPLSDHEKGVLLETLRTSPLILDENQNTVLHLAAAIKEWPDFIDQLVAVRPELEKIKNLPNKQGVTPSDLALHLKHTTTSHVAPLKVVIFQPSRQTAAMINREIARKLQLAELGKPEEPFTFQEKIRVLNSLKDSAFISPDANTELHMAAGIHSYPDLIQDLLKINPSLINKIDAYNNKGFAALDIAIIKQNVAAVKALRNAGARETRL